MSAAAYHGVIDAHAHLRGCKHVPVEVMRRVGLRRLVNINYMSSGDHDHTRAFGDDLDREAAAYGDAFLSCTTFPLASFGTARFADEAITFLEERFASHPETVAVKIWKNVGLELRDASGLLVQCDDPRFSPILAWIEERGIAVYLHIGDPIVAWQRLDPESPHYRYYTCNPQYHFHGRANVPAFEELMATQSRLIARWPRIRFIAAHLAAQAHDVALVANFLQRHSNAAVDTSARHADLRCQHREGVRDLFLTYPDRILFGTDWSARYGDPEPQADEKLVADQVSRLEWDFAYFESELALPEQILCKFYRENATRWLGLEDSCGSNMPDMSATASVSCGR